LHHKSKIQTATQYYFSSNNTSSSCSYLGLVLKKLNSVLVPVFS